MLFSSGPTNVLTDLLRSGRIEINYTFDKGGQTMIALDHGAFASQLFPQILETMSRDGGKQRMGFKITPRSAQGKKFTTGNETLDQLAGNALQLIEGGCEYPETQIYVDTLRREHRLVFPRVYVHLISVSRSRGQGEFALATDLTISTKGAVTFGNITTS